MKVYVDKIPKCCGDCPCAIKSRRQQFKDKERMMDTFMEDCMHCIPLDKWIVEKHKDCPLQSLTDYTKQVRKEVCDKIRKSSPRKYEAIDDMYYCISSLFLDQLQGEGE